MKNRLLLIFFFLCCWLSSWSQVKQAELLGHWKDSSIVGSSFYNNAYNEIWGYHTDDREYAIIGSTEGTHFIDVTDPSNLFEAFRIPGAAVGRQIVHRDYHNYGHYLYAVSDEGASTLQIMDLSFLPDSVPVIYNSADRLSTVHNIFIDSSRARLYVLIGRGGDAGFSPMRVYDISAPLEPRYLGSFNNFEGFSVSQVHDAYIERDTAFLNCGPSGFVIADFSDTDSVKTIATMSPADYPQSGYNHSGWVSCNADFYFMADETWGMDLKVLDIRDIRNPVVIDTIDSGSNHISSIPHNPIVACNYLYTAYYYDGLQVHDISDPENIVRVMHYPSSSLPTRRNYEGAWGVYPFLPSGNILLSDMQEGLFVLEGPGDSCNVNKSCGLISKVNNKASRELSAFEIYPNPGWGNIHVELRCASDMQAILQLHDLRGTLIYSARRELKRGFQRFDLDLGRYPKGMYLFSVETGAELLRKKVIIR